MGAVAPEVGATVSSSVVLSGALGALLLTAVFVGDRCRSCVAVTGLPEERREPCLVVEGAAASLLGARGVADVGGPRDVELELATPELGRRRSVASTVIVAGVSW